MDYTPTEDDEETALSIEETIDGPVENGPVVDETIDKPVENGPVVEETIDEPVENGLVVEETIDGSVENGLNIEETIDKPVETAPTLEERLDGVRNKLIERFPWTEGALGDIDIKIWIAQTIGNVLPTILANYLFFSYGSTPAEYTAIMAIITAVNGATIAGSYVATHYLMDESWRGRKKELVYEAARFTLFERATFIPVRLIALGIENLLVGPLGVSQFIAGNVIPTALLGMQTLAANRSGKEINEGKTLGEAFKEGIDMAGQLLYLPIAAVKSCYQGLRRATQDEPVAVPDDDTSYTQVVPLGQENINGG